MRGAQSQQLFNSGKTIAIAGALLGQPFINRFQFGDDLIAVVKITIKVEQIYSYRPFSASFYERKMVGGNIGIDTVVPAGRNNLRQILAAIHYRVPRRFKILGDNLDFSFYRLGRGNNQIGYFAAQIAIGFNEADCLIVAAERQNFVGQRLENLPKLAGRFQKLAFLQTHSLSPIRSEERRVGKEWRSR